MKPKEIDVNISQMLVHAMRELLDGLRVALRRFDDIDALDRVLNGGTTGIHGSGTIERLLAEQRNGNGNGGHRPAPRQPRQNSSKRVDMAALQTAALAALRAGPPEGLSTVDIGEQLLRAGVLLPAMVPSTRRAAIIRALKNEAEAGHAQLLNPKRNRRAPMVFRAVGPAANGSREPPHAAP